MPDDDKRLEDRVRTGCLGTLIPLTLGIFGIHEIIHPRKVSYLFHAPADPHASIRIDFCALGLAVITHAFGFVPYQRFQILRYLLGIGGVALFVYGLARP
jgi:hypothetical protein